MSSLGAVLFSSRLRNPTRLFSSQLASLAGSRMRWRGISARTRCEGETIDVSLISPWREDVDEWRCEVRRMPPRSPKGCRSLLVGNATPVMSHPQRIYGAVEPQVAFTLYAATPALSWLSVCIRHCHQLPTGTCGVFPPASLRRRAEEEGSPRLRERDAIAELGKKEAQ